MVAYFLKFLKFSNAYRLISTDDVAMAIEEQLLGANDTFVIDSGSSALPNEEDFFRQVITVDFL